MDDLGGDDPKWRVLQIAKPIPAMIQVVRL